MINKGPIVNGKELRWTQEGYARHIQPMTFILSNQAFGGDVYAKAVKYHDGWRWYAHGMTEMSKPYGYFGQMSVAAEAYVKAKRPPPLN